MEYPYLNQAQDPARLKAMSPEELRLLAQDIREKIVEVVSHNGGHLASNLGVVEATLAIHRVFDVGRDQVIWDVGHQSYVHKLLTGRQQAFDTLRTLDGVSGFPKRGENPADGFDTGHSTTSISVALGMARARDLLNQKHHVVAFIGDGSLTGGMAWEAMNDAGHKREKLIVILNDNEMSISRNVGALSAHLAQLRARHWYTSLKHWIRDRVGPIPLIGQPIYRLLGTIRDHTKYTLLSRQGGILFEEMGWTYIGPIDGHDIRRMEEVLEQVKDLDEPVIVHIRTQKGRGYAPAQQRPDRYHGVGPFDVQTGATAERPKGYSDVVGETLVAMAWKDSRVCAITAAMPDGCGLSLFRDRFPRRYFDVAIAEQHAVTMAAGMAAGGLRPVVCIYATFMQRAYDQLLEDVCLQRLPVVLCLTHTGISGEDGETHQGVYTLSYLSGLPNMKILMASSAGQLRAMITYALTQPDPVAICYPKTGPMGKMDSYYRPAWARVWGKGDAPVAIIATGVMVETACSVAKRPDVQADVYDASILKPLDTAMLSWILARYKRVYTLEDMVPSGGLGQAVADYAQHAGAKVSLRALRLPDAFIPHGQAGQLRARYGLDEDGVYRAVKEEGLP